MRRVEPRWLVIFGVLISSAGLFTMSRFNLYVDFRSAMWSRIIQSAGMAFLFVPISAAAFAYIPKERTNYATGLFNLARNIGGSSGIATVTTLLARRAQFHQQILTSHLTPYDASYQAAHSQIAQLLHQKGASLPDAAVQAHGVIYGMTLRQSSMLAFADAFWVMAVLFIAIIPMMLMMRKAGPVRGPVVVE